jgi:hypothetical protein
MNQELEALLRAYREFHEAPAERAEELGFAYQTLLLEHSKRSGFAAEVIERALKARYERVTRADAKRPGSMPPRA